MFDLKIIGLLHSSSEPARRAELLRKLSLDFGVDRVRDYSIDGLVRCELSKMWRGVETNAAYDAMKTALCAVYGNHISPNPIAERGEVWDEAFAQAWRSWCRQRNPEYWTGKLLARLLRYATPGAIYVVGDIQYLEEFQAVSELGGKIFAFDREVYHWAHTVDLTGSHDWLRAIYEACGLKGE
jgi:hypothetical protein